MTMFARFAVSRARVPALFRLAIAILVGLVSSLKAGAEVRPDLKSNFLDPPADARPWVMWMWLSSNLTREGLTADLEAMKRVGIGGALIMDVDQNTPAGPMQFMDSTWQGMFRHAVAEAQRLGLELNFNNGAGYYGSGGPWITPEQGMQGLVKSETVVLGGQRFDGVLPRPRVSTDDPPKKPGWTSVQPARRFAPGADYRDVAVIAIATPAADRALMAEANPQLFDAMGKSIDRATLDEPIVLKRGTSESPEYLHLQFPQAYTAGVLELDVKKLVSPVTGKLEYREGDLWKTLTLFSVGPFNWRNAPAAFPFEPTTSSAFRLSLSAENDPTAQLEITSVELHLRYRIDDPFKMKLFGWRDWISYESTQSAPLTATMPKLAAIPQNKVIDLTNAMTPDGRLTWDVPAGEWTVLRVGHAFTGAMIGPTPDATSGPETDKLSLAATELHFKRMITELRQTLPASERLAWKGVHIDSWEGGGQNWTPGFEEEFQRRRGYDLRSFLPVAFGRVVGDLQLSERFLWDLRKTVSELMIQAYVAPMQRLAHEQQLKLAFECYTTIGNDLDAANFVDEPIGEFWPHRPDDGFRSTNKAMASAAHLNGRSIVGAESFDADEKERFLEHPATLKPFADELLSSGVNRIIVHRYAAQPFADRVPGLQMGPWGQHYERTQTWWELTGPWHDYLARCQFMLRQGSMVADVLELQSEEPLLRFHQTALEGYNYDACSPDVLSRVEVQDGLLHVKGSSGNKYRVLSLAHTGTMTLELMKQLRELVRAGATIVGDPPLATPGLTNSPRADAELAELVDELWGREVATSAHAFGRGKVFRKTVLSALLPQMEILPDFAADKKVYWIHRSTPEADIYFVANSENHPVVANCTFRASAEYPERWDAEGAKITPLFFAAKGADGRTRVPLSLAAHGSAFVVFRKDLKESNIGPTAKLSHSGRTIVADGIAVADASDLVNLTTGEVHQAGKFTIETRSPTHVIEVSCVGPRVFANIPDDGWTLSFPSNGGAPPTSTLPTLTAWNAHEAAGVRHFSGTATYRNTFTPPASTDAGDKRVYLDLGEVHELARVKLNGVDLGILWRAPFRIDITEAIKPGPNLLEVAVTNLWINRLIGDELLPEDSERNADGTLKSWPEWLLKNQPSPTGRFTFSSWRLWKKDEALQPSGLLGPVRVEVVEILPL